MNTRLTVADVRAALAPDFPDFNLSTLNEVREKFYNSGKWKGLVLEVDFPSSDGYITLPYEFESVLCTTYDRVPVMTYTQFHTYQINGPGELDRALRWPGFLVDLGDGYATQIDIKTAGTLRVVTDAADNGKFIRINGLNQNGQPVFSPDGTIGEVVTCTAPYVTTTNQFSAVTGIQASPDPLIVMQKGWTLYSNGDSAIIGTYYPGESRPLYRRYQTSQAEKKIRLLCQRRFIPVRNESDWVIPGNISALRAGYWAWQFQNGSDVAQAENSFATGLNLLNQEAKTLRGGATPGTAFVNWYAMGGCGYAGGNGGSIGNSYGFGNLVTT